MRNLEGETESVSTEEQREEAVALANELEEWLYEDGWSEDAATYRKKRSELASVSVRYIEYVGVVGDTQRASPQLLLQNPDGDVDSTCFSARDYKSAVMVVSNERRLNDGKHVCRRNFGFD